MARPRYSGLAPTAPSPIRPIGFQLGRETTVPPVDRDVSHLFSEVLSQAPEAGAYYLGRRLAELFPQRSLIETVNRAFDVESFAWAGHCTTTERCLPTGQRMTTWEESNGQFWHAAHHVWLEVQWGDENLDVIICKRDELKHAVILADSHEAADRFFAAVCRWHDRPREETIMVFNGYDWCHDSALLAAIKQASLDTLILRPGLKEELLHDTTSFFAARETYERYRVAWRRGILLLGPPGNGKTHAVKALVNAVDRPCLYVRTFRSPRTPDEVNMRRVFVRARTAAPCILVFEDLDALITEENRAFFLNELDGFESNAGILTLATTNHPERLDPAIIDRPSRFDRKYAFDLPGRTERAAYIGAWNSRLEPELQLSFAGVGQLAGATDGFSFAYLKELLVAASIRWMAAQKTGTMDAIAFEQALALSADVAGRAVPEARSESRGDTVPGVAYGRISGEANDGYDRGGRRAVRRRVP